ncbi:MAG TPA: flagellar hook-basal body complex protein [Bradyrhizobium sp.]|jgi:flagellar hook protein FlgE|nr:flagellar hook-basal body complex protein [Bradyrhizobium sp.]
MGIFDALTTAVSGLSAQSFALQNISGNIANASTVGYKGIDTTFEDLIPNATVANKQVAGGVTAFSSQTITTQGTVSNSTVATNMAINGDGFFSVQKPSSVSDNVPVFSGVTDYTRRGDFQVDANGNLVNGAGYYLMGVDVDPKTGNPTGNVPHVLQFQNNFIPAQATTAITYAANLPTTPKTTASTGAAAKTITADGGLNPNDFSANPTVVGTAAPSVDALSVGAAATSQNLSAISSATALSGTSGSDSLTTGFAAGDTITVDGTIISFVSGATNLSANQISITDNVGTLMSAIGNITGVTPTIAANGAITLHTGTASNLSITTSGTNATNALGAMGITAPVTKPMGVGTNTGQGYVAGSDVTTFTNESISGGAVTAYNAAGTPVNVQLRWAKVDSASLGTGHQDVWNLYYQADTTATASNQQAWVNVGTNFVFNANGSLSSPTGTSLTIPSVAVDNQQLGNLTMNITSGALTQFASSSGAATINGLTQNGFAAGQLQSVAINNSGIVVGTFSNGQNIDLAAVTLSHFNGTNYLKALDGGAYEATDQSGPAIIGASGTISGSSLEGSNTDIADEFTKLIVTQQAYSANTKVITTANDMVQSLLAVLR